MTVYNVIVDCNEETEELCAVLISHDDTGDVDPVTFIKALSVCGALAYCNAKVSPSDRGEYDPGQFHSQLSRIDDMIKEYYVDDSYSIVKTAADKFIAAISTSLIMALKDQSHVPIFSKIKDDMSVLYKVMDGKDENLNTNGVSRIS